MFKKFKDTVKDLSSDVKESVTEKEIDEDDIRPLLEKFRLKLLENNVSYEAAEGIEKAVEQKLLSEKAGRFSVEEKVKKAISEELEETINDEYSFLEKVEGLENPSVFFVGFNGSGKTTTLAKISRYLEENGHDSVLGAGDTFRAASMEQLEEHGEKLGKKVVKHEYKSDPAAVAYDAIEHAENQGKVALIDTAGRSHSDRNLMKELEKMMDVNEPDITFLVVDALSGNDVTEQIEAYQGMFDAVIVSKMDIDDKGGTVISVSYKTDRPVVFKGTGQEYDDLEVFDKKEFVKEILE
ncbi:MAG: AAA family ATPase [Candidatus Nanohaloarchaea archaeon]